MRAFIRMIENHIAASYIVVALLVALLFPGLVHARAQEEGTILLRNVVLIDRSGDGGDVSVNILIKDSNLDLITEELIPIDEADVSYDAAGGVVLGELKLGKPASFLILRDDPAKNPRLLLDTKAHATFAMYQGEIIKNTFVTIINSTPEEEQRKQGGWLAYAPPPLAIPINYSDHSKFNRFDTKYVSGLFTGAVVLDRQYWSSQDSDSEFQVGDLKTYDGGEIRGLRFGGVGTLNFESPWIWTVFGATHAFDQGFDSTESDDYSLFDLRLDIPVWEKASFSIGKQKEPISMERLMALGHGPMGERAAVSDALLPSRNVGVVMAGNPLDDRMTLAAGVFNNWLDKDQPNSFSDNASQFVGRVTWIPLFSQNESTLLHFGAGLRYSDGKEGFKTQSGPEFNQAPDYVATNFLQTDAMTAYQAEMSLRSGPFWLHGEYARTDVDAPRYDDPSMDGYHVTASWIMTGEVRPYNKRVGIFRPIPIARTVDQNGWGAWEVGLRYSTLDGREFLDPDGLDAGDMDVWSLALNWWLSPRINININYRYATLDRFGVEGTSDGFVSRIMLVMD